MRTLAAAILIGTAGVQGEDSAWVQLFNGRDLGDWDIKFTKHPLNTNFNNTFKVVDGVLKVDYGGWGNFNGEFGHAANKPRTWSYYLLRVEYRVGDRQVNGGPAWALQNNGLMLHSQSMASMTLNQDFPVSLETQLLGAANVGADNNSSLKLCTPGTGFHLNPTGGSPSAAHCQSAATAPRPSPGEWTRVSVFVMGDSVIRHNLGDNLSGNAVFTYYRPVYLSGGISSPPSNLPANGTPLKSGYIAIQAETHPYDFRKIGVLDLEGCMDRSKAAYRAYFLRSKPGACDVTGLGKHQDALPENLSLLRNSGGFAYLSTEAGILEVADPTGRTLFRAAVTAGVPNSLALTRRGLYLVTWRSTAATARFKLTFL
jgi:hypothetical protein